MKTYFKGFELEERVRTQPWTTAERDENEQYYNFRRNPELIPEVLEDYKPWDQYEAVRRFYDFVAWVNGEESQFESNDSAFKGPSENSQKEKYPKKLACSGRFMFFFRNLNYNLSVDSRKVKVINGQASPNYNANMLFEWLVRRSMELIGQLHQETEWACIAPEMFAVFYSEAPVYEADRFGHEVSFQFWAWGDDEQETMDNLGVVVNTMVQVLKTLSIELPGAIKQIVNNSERVSK